MAKFSIKRIIGKSDQFEFIIENKGGNFTFFIDKNDIDDLTDLLSKQHDEVVDDIVDSVGFGRVWNPRSERWERI